MVAICPWGDELTLFPLMLLNWAIIGLENDFPPVWHQAII